MRLLRLSLKNWRGVDARDVVFAAGVTLIEGPNEIGKSTIVEAIRMLFNELDSSKKQTIRAIKPVHKDVGSTVEVEVKSGEYHFIYAKTFNKSPQTSLDVLAPGKKQVTGREAHELVVQMLGKTVDMALWEALLVDQGEKVALANIQSSAGLASALDEAAGAAAAGNDDTDLYEAVQAEYEKYYTLKTGKPRFVVQQEAFEKAEKGLQSAQRALAEVEATVEAHERSMAEVDRIRAELPRLKEIADDHGKNWQAVKSLQETVDIKDKELAHARALQHAALDARKNRLDLGGDVLLSQTKVAEAKKALEPLQLNAKKIKDQTDNAQRVLADLRKQVKAARAEFDLAHADEQHLQSVEALAKEQARLDQLRKIAKDKTSSLQVAGAIKINDTALEQLRAAESRVAIARGTRNTAATTISITAEKNLQIEMDGEEIALGDAAVETRSVAAQMQVRLPGVATIEVIPPQSVAELQAEFEESEEALSRLMNQFDVTSLQEAVAANERRADAQRNVDRLKHREQEILDGASGEEIEQAICALQAEGVRYAQQRQSQQRLPETLALASELVSTMKSRLVSREEALEKAHEKADALQTEYGELDGQLRIAQQNLAGFEAALADKEERLTKLRSDTADSILEKRASVAAAKADTLENEAAQLQAELDKSSPDTVEVLMNNAVRASERARADLIEEQRNLAIVADRLQQAQADGRFEAREAAEKDLQEAQWTLESTRRRAEAIALLWNTLRGHRDNTRKTYVKPLQEAIERLGRIVFGSGFEIEIGDDWAVLTRTLNGITLPFEYLSVGAKEQLGILARLAAAQIVARQGGVPLIIDDALGFSDPARLETIGAAIAAAGKETQIIILTCTPGRFTHVGSAEVVRF